MTYNSDITWHQEQGIRECSLIGEIAWSPTMRQHWRIPRCRRVSSPQFSAGVAFHVLTSCSVRVHSSLASHTYTALHLSIHHTHTHTHAGTPSCLALDPYADVGCPLGAWSTSVEVSSCGLAGSEEPAALGARPATPCTVTALYCSGCGRRHHHLTMRRMLRRCWAMWAHPSCFHVAPVISRLPLSHPCLHPLLLTLSPQPTRCPSEQNLFPKAHGTTSLLSVCDGTGGSFM
ncbi:hypothetical protein JB92DRAFT_755792 [Gautieria morchelliformis]|nr:hypothetical protein JB92DRAFT_755792 [Gautieria morchelliformis]